MKMTRAQIEQRIKELKERKFYIDMIDHWTNRDEIEYIKVTNELYGLMAELREITK